MKAIVKIFFVIIFFVIDKTNAQKINLSIVTTGYHGAVDIFDPCVNFNPDKFITVIPLAKNGTAAYTANLSKPGYINLFFNLPNFVAFQYTLFLTPGDELLFKVDFKNNVPTISVSGKGSNNNQPLILSMNNLDLTRFKDDKTPDRVIAAINYQQARNEINLKEYIKEYKPSTAFVKYAQLNNAYFALNKYYGFYHSKYPPFENHPGHTKWQKIEDSLMAKTNINNDNALIAENYDNFIQNFIIQEPPILMQQETQEPTVFYREWYGTTVKKGKEVYTKDGRNLFIEKIINRYFKGKTGELAYAGMLRFFLRFKHDEGLDIVFDHFEHKYPSSSYIPIFREAIAEIVVRKKQSLNTKMIFVADDGTKLTTLNDVIRLMSGKTVFVDMWGTWCSPCRIELEKFAPQIRDHFARKNIAFLYIANKDIDHKDEWKKVIAYYKIEGIHILANAYLEKDIMTRLKSTGYPTHFIIRKDGSFKKIKTQDESNTQQVIKEIEDEL